MYPLGATASSGLTVTYVSSNMSVATISGNTVTTVGLGSTTITASQAGDSNYNPATDVTQTLTVFAPPAVTASLGSLAAFSASTPNPSLAQAFTVSGSNLTANLVVTPPTGYEVSQISATTGFAASQSLTPSSGAVATTTIYARLIGASAGSFSGNIAVTSTGATTQNVAVTGTVVAGSVLIAGWDFQTTTNGGTATAASPSTPTLYVANVGSGTLYLDGSNGASTWSQSTELSSFSGTAINAGGATGLSTTTTGAASLALLGGSANSANGKSIVFKVNMTGRSSLVVSYATQRSTTGFSQSWEYSTNGTSWTSAGSAITPGTSFALQTLSSTSLLDGAATAYARVTFSGSTGSNQNNRIDNVQLNASTVTPSITVSGGPIAAVDTTYPAASPTPTSFTLTGTGLSAGISLAALSPFEYSTTEGGTYTSTLSLPSTGGTVFVRLAAGTAAGTYSGSIVASSGATTLSIPLATSKVSKANQTITFAPSAFYAFSAGSVGLTATSSSGLTVSLAGSNDSVATVAGSTLTFVSPGSLDVTATQTGDANYNAATPVVRTIVITGPFASNDSTSKPTISTAIKIPVAFLLSNDTRVDTSGATVSGGMTVVSATGSGGNTATLAGAFVFFTPNPGVATETFTYVVSDGSSSATGTVTVSTAPVVTTTFSLNVVNIGLATFDSGGNLTSKTVDFIAVPGQSIIVEYSTDLMNWTQFNGGTPVSTGATGSFFTTFTEAGDQTTLWNTTMYYRGRLP